MSKIQLVYDTVKYLKARQFAYRGWYYCKGKIKKRPYKKGYAFAKINRLSAFYKNASAGIENMHIADDIMNNIFPFYADDRIELKDNDWNLCGNSYRLKCFKLNSFDWLINLKCAYDITGDYKYINRGFELIDEWIEASQNSNMGDKWNAYVTANRIKNWIGYISLFAKDDEIDKYAYCISLAVKELRHSIEYQLGANHLLSEAKALMYGGFFLDNKNVYDYGKNLLKKEYTEQFLEDGGHYERSVSYHVEALQQYFEAAYLMNVCKDKDFVPFLNMMKKSYVFLHNMIEVNGKIPLFNDAADDYTCDATDFLATSRLLYKSASPRAKASTYYKMWFFDNKQLLDIEWQDLQAFDTGIYKDLFLVGDVWYDIMMDVGNNGPDYNLGHTHADDLSLLLTCENGRIFADAGVFTYEKCDRRYLCRRTRSHNTIEIDGKDSAQVWGAFRTAKRGHTRIVDYENNKESVRIKAVSDGYKNTLKSPVIHTREYTRRTKDNYITIRDILNSDAHHKGVLRFNLSKDCTFEIKDEYSLVINDNIEFQCSAKIDIERCQIAERFGKVIDTYCIVAHLEFEGDIEVITNLQFRRN